MSGRERDDPELGKRSQGRSRAEGKRDVSGESQHIKVAPVPPTRTSDQHPFLESRCDTRWANREASFDGRIIYAIMWIEIRPKISSRWSQKTGEREIALIVPVDWERRALTAARHLP